MNEDNLFQIQNEQVAEEIEKIKWIANNPDKLIHALRAKVAESNGEYFAEDAPPVSWIFRGTSISTWLTNHVAYEILKETEECTPIPTSSNEDWAIDGDGYRINPD